MRIETDGGGYRVDKVHEGRYLSEGTPDRHAALLTWLRDRAGLPPDGDVPSEGSFTHRLSTEGGGTVEVTVRVTPEVVGHRTTIASASGVPAGRRRGCLRERPQRP